MRDTMKLLTGVWLALLLSIVPVRADLFPPWIDPQVGVDLRGLSAEELYKYSDWYLKRQDEPAVRNSSGFLVVPYAIYDLAYPYLTPGNENRDLAVQLAERIGLRSFEAKEILLADLKYGPNGTSPDDVQLDHAVRKTALFLIKLPAFQFFPHGHLTSAETDFEAVEEALFQKFLDRTQIAFPGSTEIQGDDGAYEIARKALNAVPIVEAEIMRRTRCDLLEESVSFLSGDSPVGYDLEMAELLAIAAYDLPELDEGYGDVRYLIARYAQEFSILDWSGSSQNFYEAAAVYGHPEASFVLAKHALRNGNLEKAIRHLTVATRQGHRDAQISLNELQKEHALVLSAEEAASVDYTVGQFVRYGCSGLAIP